jgi:hypothetical protein
MNPYSIQNHFTVYAIDPALLLSIDQYINNNIPQILQLNLEKGNEKPLDVNVTVTIRKTSYILQFGSISNCLNDCFSDDVQEVIIELAHDNRFNFRGRKIVVLILNFDLVNGVCHFSLALNGMDAKQHGTAIYKDLKSILIQHKEPVLG